MVRTAIPKTPNLHSIILRTLEAAAIPLIANKRGLGVLREVGC